MDKPKFKEDLFVLKHLGPPNTFWSKAGVWSKTNLPDVFTEEEVKKIGPKEYSTWIKVRS